MSRKRENIMTRSQFERRSQSELRLGERGGDPYRDLADAVICVAADDYRLALEEGNEPLRKEVEEFFLSAYFKRLTRLSGVEILERLRAEFSGENPS